MIFTVSVSLQLTGFTLVVPETFPTPPTHFSGHTSISSASGLSLVGAARYGSAVVDSLNLGSQSYK